ncbi:MAG: hypothetical protein KC933_14465 [Myxococcales bacterium]|nr:hypothetical protein [Myxococcales bacterium]MCB9651470.1 hypothetical protein [Deltaproteobacteria bacterium]
MQRAVVLSLLALTVAACEDTQLTQGRADSGVAASADAGTDGPLPLEAGMTFTYEGRLTARGVSAGDEKSAVYTLVVHIDSVADRGAAGESTLAFSATGQNLLNQDWTDVWDFSSWVARLGPALQTDLVGAAAVTANLSQVPQLPTRANPKVLPTGSFFIDVRRIVDLRVRFAEVYADAHPRVVDPAQNGGKWLFELEGDDSAIITYDVQRRKVRIEYDPRGFITRIDETLGELGSGNSGTNTLVLKTGP